MDKHTKKPQGTFTLSFEALEKLESMKASTKVAKSQLVDRAIELLYAQYEHNNKTIRFNAAEVE